MLQSSVCVKMSIKKKHGTSRIGNIRIVIKFIRCLKLIMTSQVDKKNKRNQYGIDYDMIGVNF